MILDDCFATILEYMNIISGFAVCLLLRILMRLQFQNTILTNLTGKSAKFLPAPPGDKCIIVLH